MTSFDRLSFRVAMQAGLCSPPNLLTPLVDISMSAYSSLAQKDRFSMQVHYEHANERMSSEAFGQMRAAAERAMRCAHDYFPAYHFHAGEFINDEWLSSVDWHKGFHRDHVSHQIMCVFVGTTLLNGGQSGECVFNNRKLLDWCVDAAMRAPECEYLREYLRFMGAPDVYFRNDSLGELLWEGLFRESFYLAAMFHDIGYPWQFVNSIHDKLKPHTPLENPVGQGADWIYEHYKHRLLLFPLNGYQPHRATQPIEWASRCRNALRDGLSLTHGVPGALAMLHLNDLLRIYPVKPQDNAVKRFCIEWAAMAIMMHDMQKIFAGTGCSGPNPHLRISLRRDPLSFALTLADQIQDFGRPNATFHRGSGGIKVKYSAQCHKVNVERQVGGSELRITYYYKVPKDAWSNCFEFKPKDDNNYFNPRTGFIDYSDLPISRIRLVADHDPDGEWWQEHLTP